MNRMVEVGKGSSKTRIKIVLLLNKPKGMEGNHEYVNSKKNIRFHFMNLNNIME
jgi:hypothetical protein